MAIFVVATPLAVATLGNVHTRLDELLVRERPSTTGRDRARQLAISIIESIIDGFFALDRQWRYVYVNHKAEQLVGRTREELLGNVL